MEVNYEAGKQDRLLANASSCVYMLYGKEDLLKQEAERALIGRFITEDFSDFDLEICSADSVSADSIVSAASQAPFGSDRRVVVVRGLEQWRDRARQAEADRLAAAVQRLAPPVCLILVVGAEEDEGRRKTAVSAKLDAAVSEFGVMVACRGLTEDSLASWIHQRFELDGKRIAPEAVELLAASAGTEMRLLELEVFKLVNFVGARTHVTTTDVSAVVASQAEDVMFQCIDAIMRRQTDRALTLLAELHRHDPKPQAVAGRLLSLLLRQLRLVWQAMYLKKAGASARDVRFLKPEIAADLPTENSITQVAFKASDLFHIADRLTPRDLQWAFERVMLCDLANKGGVTEEASQFSAEPAQNLQLLVLQLTAGTFEGV